MNHNYIAGLFDGEGSVAIIKSTRANCRVTQLQVYINLTIRERFLVERLKEAFGGSTCLLKSRSVKHAAYWRWTVVGEAAARFAAAIAPRSLLKKRQLELVMEFQAAKRSTGNRPRSAGIDAQLHDCYNRLRGMNRKGPEHGQRVKEKAPREESQGAFCVSGGVALRGDRG